MDKIKLEIYNILKNIKKLDSKNYSDLLKKYDEDLVNQVIENMIDEDIDDVFKFEYYISLISYVDDEMAKSVFDAYSIDLKSIPVLTREENIKLASEIHNIIQEIKNIMILDNFDINNGSWFVELIEEYLVKCQDLDKLNKLNRLYKKFLYNRNKLTEGNLKLVIAFSKQYYKSGVDINDIIQCGNMGMLKACERFDPSFNTSFSTYAYYWIKQSITKNIAYVSYPVSVPLGVMSFNMLMKKKIMELWSKLDREPTIEEIAEYMEVSVEKINNTMATFSNSLSLNESLKGNGEDDDVTFMDLLVDDKSSVFKEVVNNQLSNELMEFLVNNLTKQEIIVLCHRYELYNCQFKKLQELGKQYGVSRERIRQIEAKAISKIKKKGKKFATYIG